MFKSGDGDSSVTKRLNEILPYGQSLRVEKIECRNHLLRNYSKKMMALCKRTDFPIDIRKKISDNILRLRTDITSAVKFHKLENKPLPQKISGKITFFSNDYYINKCILGLVIRHFFKRFLPGL